MTFISLLTRRFLRRALSRPNLTYYLWRFVANGIRTYKLLTTHPDFDKTAGIADVLSRHGIVVGHCAEFLTDAGQRALRDAADRILQVSCSKKIGQLMRGEIADTSQPKDFMVQLLAYPDGIPVVMVAASQRHAAIFSGWNR